MPNQDLAAEPASTSPEIAQGPTTAVTVSIDPGSRLVFLQEPIATVPAIVADSGPQATERFLEFFTATIRNQNTRRAYARQVAQFLHWCQGRQITELQQIRPITVAAYIEQRVKTDADPQTVKQGLAAVRMLFDWLVTGQIVPSNPATSVRGPKYSYNKGKTPVLSAEDTRALLDSIDASNVVGLRDRALIALMTFTFARVGAVTSMRVSDYYQNGKRWFVRLHEKGGKYHELPVHHQAEEYLDAYLDAACIREDVKTPLFRTTHGRSRLLTGSALTERDALRVVNRRVTDFARRNPDARLPTGVCNHTFRATGITTYLENGGTMENAQAIAAHESPKTTKLYDRRSDQINLAEIERIRI
jgi:site-specific recombinase XerD